MTMIVLDNLRSKHNVGAIFRTADAVAVDKIFLCGTTPQPVDRFGRPVAAILKTALGAECTVDYTYHQDSLQVVHSLQALGHSVWAVEQTPGARDLVHDDTLALPRDSVFVFGNEVVGVQESILKHADGTIALPMLGSKESLNVSVAVGAVLYLHRLRSM